MKNVDIITNISITGQGVHVINSSKIIPNNTLIVETYNVTPSQAEGGYLYFKNETGFQDILKVNQEIVTFSNKKEYSVRTSNREKDLGKINGLSELFADSEIIKNNKLRVQLLVDKKPLEMYIEKL